MKLTNRIIRAGLLGQSQYHILSGKPTDNPNVSVYLLIVVDEKEPLNTLPDYSLWNIEMSDDDGSMKMWPYKGEDYDALTLELGKNYIENAFSESNETIEGKGEDL